ncbi:MAG: c-type cytochrome [Pseudomonadota bacterium]
MKPIVAALLLALALAACTEQGQSPGKPALKAPPGDAAAGRAFAERECKACHGLDGKGTAPAIPHLAAQSEAYLVLALKEYQQRKRLHAALREIASHMTEADMRNLAAFYASRPPVQASGEQAKRLSPYERGKELAAACAKCHGVDGNSAAAGIPSLAGQQPHYLVVAIQEYLLKERKAAPMHGLLPGLARLDMESLALYFASQAPAARAAPAAGDPALGEPLSAVCGGCHGSHGVSTDGATPTLAGQDAAYLVEAIKAYRTTRKREKMRAYVAGLSDKDIEHLAAFYATQKSRPAEKGQTLVQELTDKCERCHGAAAGSATFAVPKIRGQDRDYLIMALRAYRDDRRESSMMHRMSLPYGDAVIESIASYYAGLPAK